MKNCYPLAWPLRLPQELDFNKLYSTPLGHHVCKILDTWHFQFLRRRILDICQKIYILAPFGAPNDPSPFILTNLNPLTLLIICTKFGQIWPSSSGEEVESVKVYGRTTDAGRYQKLTLSF